MDMVNLNTKMKESTKNKLYLDTCKELLDLEKKLGVFHCGLFESNHNLSDYYMTIKSASFLPYEKQDIYLEKLERRLFAEIFEVSNEIYLGKKKILTYKYEDSSKLKKLTDLYGVWEEDTKHDYFKQYVSKAMENINNNSCFNESESSNKK